VGGVFNAVFRRRKPALGRNWLPSLTHSETVVPPLPGADSVMTKHTPHQQKIIRNFYENREGIAVQRLQELATELYLSSGKKQEQYWKQLRGHLEKLGVAAERIDYVLSTKDPALVAKIAAEFFAKQ
jgi:hypothetical protein